MASKDEAAQARILKHMNADHSASLSLYLQHFASVPPALTSPPTLTTITFTEMTILDSSKTPHTIPITPALTSWAQAREAAVRMDREARSALGLDGVTVTRYLAPRGWFQQLIFAVCGLTMLSIGFRAWIVPGTAVYGALQRVFPGGAEMFLKLNGLVAWPMFGIHFTEMAYLARKAGRHGVRFGSGLWFAWMGSCFVEGLGAISRFNGEVEKGRKEKDH